MNIQDIKKALEKSGAELYIADINYSTILQGKPLTKGEVKALEYTREALSAVRCALVWINK